MLIATLFSYQLIVANAGIRGRLPLRACYRTRGPLSPLSASSFFVLSSYQFDMINGMPANSLKRRLENAVNDADARLREEMRATETQSGGESASGSRGNLRQRIERASANPSSSSSSTGPAQPFPLVDSLKKHWAAGRLSTPMAKK